MDGHPTRYYYLADLHYQPLSANNVFAFPFSLPLHFVVIVVVFLQIDIRMSMSHGPSCANTTPLRRRPPSTRQVKFPTFFFLYFAWFFFPNLFDMCVDPMGFLSEPLFVASKWMLFIVTLFSSFFFSYLVLLVTGEGGTSEDDGWVIGILPSYFISFFSFSFLFHFAFTSNVWKEPASTPKRKPHSFLCLKQWTSSKVISLSLFLSLSLPLLFDWYVWMSLR